MPICQTCLRTGECVQPMTSQDSQAYSLFITKEDDPLHILYVCIYCRSFLQKVVKFMGQCQTSDAFIRDVLNNDTDTTPKIQTNYLQITEPACHYVGPDVILEEVTIKPDGSVVPFEFLNESNGNDSNDYNDGIPDNIIVENVMMENIMGENIIVENIMAENITAENIMAENITAENITAENIMAENIMVDDTVIDLNMDCTEDNIQTDNIQIQTTTEPTKKNVKKGFSSRMVTETHEYTVIKMSNEEIKEEMIKYSQSDKYKMLPYKCGKCVKGFNFDDVLNNHLEKHSPNNGPFQCELCEQYCPSRVSLRGHMKSHTTRYKCKLCDIIRLSRQHILEHYSLQHSGMASLYTCPECPYTSNKRTGMQRHINLHSKKAAFHCQLCGKTYKTKESLRVHVMRHNDKKLYKCDTCESSFIYVSQLTKHLHSVHDRKEYYCVECDINFKSTDNLKRHLRQAKKHRNAKSYCHPCNLCEMRFVSEPTLATHRASVHGVEKSLICDQCSSRYSCLSALQGHIRRVHTENPEGTARLPCPHCDKTFKRRYILRAHIRTHGTQRPVNKKK